MVQSIVLAASAVLSFASLSVAAPASDYGYESLHGFPVCKYEVAKPAYDKNGYGYGWENGKSCILKKGSYEAPKYEAPKYEAPKYEQPKYEQPKYEAPKYEQPKYEQPKYATPTYQTPTYQTPAYQTPAYQTPAYQAPAYQTPAYQPKAAFAAQANSYPAPQCAKDYYDATYKDCAETFEYVKAYYCPPYAGTAAGDCITKVASVFDKCIAGIDKGVGYCWDESFFVKYSGSSYGYEAPAQKQYFAPAANSYQEKYEWDSGYPVCKYKVEKPAWDPKGRGYGWENGKSCILKKDYGYQPKYEAPKYEQPKYEAPKYEAPKYEAPKYEQPKYEQPKYEQPKYQQPSYQQPSYTPAPSYSAPKQYFAPAANSYQEKYEWDSGYPVCKYKVEKPAYDPKGRGYGWENGKSCILKKDYGYQPKYEAPKYEQPKYEAPKYEQPKYESYQQPSYTPAPSYSAPKQYFVPAANSYQEKYEWDSGYPVCKYKVDKPAYDPKGRGYGWENGKSCILKKDYGYQPKYEAPKYEAPKYEAPKYEAPKYEAPKYEQPKYEAPKYEQPKYQQPSYQQQSYQQPKYAY